MTVSYQYDVASSTSGGFTRLLFKWKGSLYKLVYRELFLFIFCYGFISVIYRYVFTDPQKRSFEHVALYCDTFMNYIPLSFILGFYVSFVASRWWQQYMAIPWPDKLLHSIAVHVTGYDEKGRILRRTMVRYLNLSLVLVLRSISSAVKRRFPTIEHIVEAGFMTTTELEIFKTIPSTEFNTYWVPFTWFTALLRDARAQKRIADPHGVKLIMEEFLDFRQMCGMLWSFDWVSIPLVYTQVVTIATYAFFFACIIGRQYVEQSPIPYKVKPDLYIPFFTLLQFFFYMGLLKVAEQLINPFGDDDEDFELNWIIDRHIKVSYMIVDTLMLKVPPITKDIYFDQETLELPYTEASVPFKKKVYTGSVAHMTVPEDQHTLMLPDIEEEELDDSRSRIAEGLLASGMFKQTNANPDGNSVTINMLDYKSSDGGKYTPSGGPSSKFSSALSSRRSSTKLGVSAGTKGSVGGAVVAFGANQVLLATGPDNLAKARGDGALDCVVLPIDFAFSDGKIIPSPQYDNDLRSGQFSNKPSFNFTSSLKSKLALKKKPVMKWKSFQRPVGKTPDGEAAVDGPILDGCYEEQSAFMWRTIDDDSVSCDQLPETTIFPSQSSQQYSGDQEISTDHRVMSRYSEPRSRTINKSRITRSDSLHSSPKLPRDSFRGFSCRRSRYKRRSGAWKETTHSSLPLLSSGSRLITNNLVARSLSENSVFVDAVAQEIRRQYSSSNSLNSPILNVTNRKNRRKSPSTRSSNRYHTAGQS